MKKFFKKIWKAIDGKKTVGGGLITAVGIIMFNFPFTAPAAPYILSTGLGVMGVGIPHKIVKNNKSKEKGNGS